MSTVLIIFFVLSILNYQFISQRNKLHEERYGYMISKQDCANSNLLLEWIQKNPDLPKTHPEFQKILRMKIGSYMLFLDAHPLCNKENDPYLQSLGDLMVEPSEERSF